MHPRVRESRGERRQKAAKCQAMSRESASASLLEKRAPSSLYHTRSGDRSLGISAALWVKQVPDLDMEEKSVE